jgi:hypothetical protein
MAQDFNAMLNDHLHYDLMKEELKKKNYLWKALEHDDDVAGDIIVPFESSRASSVKAGGGPVDVSAISKHQYVRGSVNFANLPKVWGSLIFNYEDILSHDGRVKAKSFLGTFLPKQVEDFTTYFAETMNHMALNSAVKDEAAGTGTVGGSIAVKRPERYEVGEAIVLDPAGANVSGFVRTINMNTSSTTGTITVFDAVTGGAAVDLSGVASGEKIYKASFQTSANQITSMRDALLSAANGGDTNIYGVSKTASKYTQAINIDGSAMSASNILEKLFDGVTEFRRKSKEGMVELWMSYKHLGSIMKILEQDKGPYKAVPGSKKSAEYAFTEIGLFGPQTGEIKLVGIQEMDDDVIFGVNPKSMKFHSVKGVQKVKSPDGNYYHTVRDSSNGYDFVCDLYWRGELLISAPHKNCVFHGITY